MNSGPGGEWFATTPTFWARLPPVVAWTLWYADGRSVSSAVTAWPAAPAEGVQVLMVHHPDGQRTIVTGRDAYTLPNAPHPKYGQLIDLDRFHAIQARAMADPWRVTP